METVCRAWDRSRIYSAATPLCVCVCVCVCSCVRVCARVRALWLMELQHGGRFLRSEGLRLGRKKVWRCGGGGGKKVAGIKSRGGEKERSEGEVIA